MRAYAALLRAVNVGGTGKLPMADLKAMAEQLGFRGVQTYLASGNLVFRAEPDEAALRAALASRLADYAGKPVGVVVRSAEELADVLSRNPFKTARPDRTVALFVDDVPIDRALGGMTGQHDEEVRVGLREIFIYYGEGMGRSKLRLPAARNGTARNMNTVAAVARLAAML